MILANSQEDIMKLGKDQVCRRGVVRDEREIKEG